MTRLFVTCFVVFVLAFNGFSMGFSTDSMVATNENITVDPFVFEDCFAADKGAAVTSTTEHAKWARSQSTGTLMSNLASKIAMVFNCTAVSNEQAIRAFGEASGVVARRVSEPARSADPSCFSNDRGSLNPDDAAHANWARTKTRAVIRDNLIWKTSTALKCLKTGEPQVELFAAISSILARTPGGATAACNGSSNAYSLPGISPPKVGTQFPINWIAPANHASDDYIGVYKANASPSDLSNRITWAVLASREPCGYIQLWAIYQMTAGEYDVYIFHADSTTPVSNGVRLSVKP